MHPSILLPVFVAVALGLPVQPLGPLPTPVPNEQDTDVASNATTSLIPTGMFDIVTPLQVTILPVLPTTGTAFCGPVLTLTTTIRYTNLVYSTTSSDSVTGMTDDAPGPLVTASRVLADSVSVAKRDIYVPYTTVTDDGLTGIAYSTMAIPTGVVDIPADENEYWVPITTETDGEAPTTIYSVSTTITRNPDVGTTGKAADKTSVRRPVKRQEAESAASTTAPLPKENRLTELEVDCRRRMEVLRCHENPQIMPCRMLHDRCHRPIRHSIRPRADMKKGPFAVHNETDEHDDGDHDVKELVEETLSSYWKRNDVRGEDGDDNVTKLQEETISTNWKRNDGGDDGNDAKKLQEETISTYWKRGHHPKHNQDEEDFKEAMNAAMSRNGDSEESKKDKKKKDREEDCESQD